MEKINVAELLKGCPSGMELDCTMYENVYFDQIYEIENCLYSIGCYTIVDGIRTSINFTKFGEFNTHMNSKCLIFPKGKTTWEGFVPPCQFKDGDVLTYMYYNKPTIYIYRKNGCCNTSYYVGYSFTNECFYKDKTGGLSGNRADLRLATEEEKEKLFDAIKANGYKWNPETKTLEKLIQPKFKVGDKITCEKTTLTIVALSSDKYIVEDTFRRYGMLHFNNQDKWKFVEEEFNPKFKVGDRIRRKNSNEEYIITSINDYIYYYRLNEHCTGSLEIKLQDEYELVSNKFDNNTLEKLVEPKFKVGDRIQWHDPHVNCSINVIESLELDRYRLDNGNYIKFSDEHYYKLQKFNITTLVPFESRVLVRNDEKQFWLPAFWGCKRSDGYITTFGYGYTNTYGCCKYCIPYDGNEHLLGTNDDCDEFYKNL